MWEKEEKEIMIRKEEKRLKRIYKDIEKGKKSTIEGLIQRAAFMRVSLAELEEDLNLYGFTEKFSQGNQEPYDRKRPNADLYNSMNTSYQKIIKQLTDLLPKSIAKTAETDVFEEFVFSRNEI